MIMLHASQMLDLLGVYTDDHVTCKPNAVM